MTHLSVYRLWSRSWRSPSPAVAHRSGRPARSRPRLPRCRPPPTRDRARGRGTTSRLPADPRRPSWAIQRPCPFAVRGQARAQAVEPLRWRDPCGRRAAVTSSSGLGSVADPGTSQTEGQLPILDARGLNALAIWLARDDLRDQRLPHSRSQRRRRWLCRRSSHQGRGRGHRRQQPAAFECGADHRSRTGPVRALPSLRPGRQSRQHRGQPHPADTGRRSPHRDSGDRRLHAGSRCANRQRTGGAGAD